MWEKKLALYDELIGMSPGIERKGKSMPFTSANGYMFSQLNKAGEIGIRLSKESGKKFMEEHNAIPFKAYGAVMKGYVLIPEAMLDDLKVLSGYLNESHRYVKSLKPKEGKK